MKSYDIIIIGTGGGNKLAGSLAKLGKKIALVEKSKAGGTCLNRGCIPSKMMIHPANRMHDLKDIERINIKSDSSIDFAKLTSRINSYTDGTSERVEAGRQKSAQIDYYKGTGRFVADKVVSVNGEELTAETIVIATGSKPLIPDIDGLAHTPFMTSNEALRAKKLPKSLIVIGGGYIATELGGAYAAFGSEVSFVLRSEFLRPLDSSLREIFIPEFSKGKTVYDHTDILSAAYAKGKFTLKIKHEGSEKEISAEELLVCAGVVPNSSDLQLENTSIQADSKGFIQVNDFLETNVPGVYAIGDVAGNFLFRHSVNFEAEYFVEANYIAESQSKIDYPPMPAAVFSNPEIGTVGLTEKEVQEQKISYIVGKAKYSSIAMAKARGLDTGLVKLIFDTSSHKLLGAHILGEEAATMIQELVLAVTHQLTAQEIYKQVYIHPAFPEVVRNALRSALKQLDEKYQILF